MQRDPPVVDVEPCAGDEPVPGAVLRPHGHLGGVHEPQHPLGGHRHRRPAGEHAGVDVEALRLTLLLPVLQAAAATAGRPRGGHARREEARLPGQPRRAARPPGLHDGAAGELGVEEAEVQDVGAVVRRDVEPRARHDPGRAPAAVVAGAPPPGVVLDRRGGYACEHPPLDRLVEAVVGVRLRPSPRQRWLVVARGGEERRGGRQVLQVDG